MYIFLSVGRDVYLMTNTSAVSYLETWGHLEKGSLHLTKYQDRMCLDPLLHRTPNSPTSLHCGLPTEN